MEIEVKLLEIEPEQMRQRLQALQARFLGREFQQNHMYDYPDRRLYEQADGSYVRLRRRRWLAHPQPAKQPEVLLTFKKTISRTGYKIADETETQVADFAAMHRFLGLMGLVEMRVDEKLRESYQLGSVHFEIDEWAGLPPYLEIEAESEADLEWGLTQLGYTLAQTTTMNLREVLAKYNIKAETLRFADFGRTIEANTKLEDIS